MFQNHKILIEILNDAFPPNAVLQQFQNMKESLNLTISSHQKTREENCFNFPNAPIFRMTTPHTQNNIIVCGNKWLFNCLTQDLFSLLLLVRFFFYFKLEILWEYHFSCYFLFFLAISFLLLCNRLRWVYKKIKYCKV